MPVIKAAWIFTNDRESYILLLIIITVVAAVINNKEEGNLYTKGTVDTYIATVIKL